jgi:hypothetical protein
MDFIREAGEEGGIWTWTCGVVDDEYEDREDDDEIVLLFVDGEDCLC